MNIQAKLESGNIEPILYDKPHKPPWAGKREVQEEAPFYFDAVIFCRKLDNVKAKINGKVTAHVSYALIATLFPTIAFACGQSTPTAHSQHCSDRTYAYIGTNMGKDNRVRSVAQSFDDPRSRIASSDCKERKSRSSSGQIVFLVSNRFFVATGPSHGTNAFNSRPFERNSTQCRLHSTMDLPFTFQSLSTNADMLIAWQEECLPDGAFALLVQRPTKPLVLELRRRSLFVRRRPQARIL